MQILDNLGFSRCTTSLHITIVIFVKTTEQKSKTLQISKKS